MATPYAPLPISEISIERIKAAIRDVPDFPKPGILFKDITTVLRAPLLLRHVVDLIFHHIKDREIQYIVGIESRGFMLASPVACALGVGFVPVRKAGKLPGPVERHHYELEYGADVVEMHKGAIEAGARVAVIDDLLATGGTASASIALLRKLDAHVTDLLFMIELEELGGRSRLPAGPEVHSLLRL